MSPDYEQPFIVATDASNVGFGAILSQVSVVDKKEHPILYMSRSLRPAEHNYSATEKECAAVVWAIKCLRHYVDNGKPFTVITDHHALQWLMK